MSYFRPTSRHGTVLSRLALGRRAWAAIIFVVLLGPANAARADGEQKRVLVLYSTRLDTQLPILGDQQFPSLLQRGLSAKVDYYAEYLDAARFPDASYPVAFRSYLKLK